MRTLLVCLFCALPCFAQVQRSESIIEVPQPPIRVRQYVPQDVDIPQPPKRYKEVTETRTYTVPLDPPIRYSTPVRSMPVYSAPVYSTPVYTAPVKYPVAVDQYGFLGRKVTVHYSDGTSRRVR